MMPLLAAMADCRTATNKAQTSATLQRALDTSKRNHLYAGWNCHLEGRLPTTVAGAIHNVGYAGRVHALL
eukprot:10955314-Lingulodinium_polyedra.AAC.1